jgi:type II secretory pathway predicted ATPase ExeA
MSVSYRVFFELQREPFTSDIQREEILVTDGLAATEKRIHYAMRIGGIAVLTGEIGSGKSTALRYVTESLHPSQYLCLYVTATTGSILELYRQILDQLGVDNRGSSRARMCQTIRRHVSELSQGKKLQVLLTVDEASLLRMEVFAELHTLLQFEKDAKPFLPLVMAGQNNLLDSLAYRPAMPLASRVVARSRLEGVNRQQMQNYIGHHLGIAGFLTISSTTTPSRLFIRDPEGYSERPTTSLEDPLLSQPSKSHPPSRPNTYDWPQPKYFEQG